ncbi:MAG: HIT family protein [Helicobacteraceae bacterium]|nr:HIT family protein [Helicobacteraceae bacterium]
MLFQTDSFYIERHESEIPWLKIFTKTPYKEMSDAPANLRAALYDALDICERALIDYYKPDKINIASFGNVVTRLHWHVMARFVDDSYFPEPMWGNKQRESRPDRKEWAGFETLLISRLNKTFSGWRAEESNLP